MIKIDSDKEEKEKKEKKKNRGRIMRKNERISTGTFNLICIKL